VSRFRSSWKVRKGNVTVRVRHVADSFEFTATETCAQPNSESQVRDVTLISFFLMPPYSLNVSTSFETLASCAGKYVRLSLADRWRLKRYFCSVSPEQWGVRIPRGVLITKRGNR